MLQLENVLFPKPVIFAVFVHAEAGFLGQQTRLDGPLLGQKGSSGRGFGQSDPSQSRFLQIHKNENYKFDCMIIARP